MTREEIRRRRTAPRLTVVVPADSVEVDSTPNDSGLDGAFRSLENQAAYALSQADVAAQQLLDQQPDPARHGAGWRFQDDGEPSPRWPHPVCGSAYLLGPGRPLTASGRVFTGGGHR